MPSAFCKPKLRALMEFARNVLIWATCFKHKAVFRFAFLRSDLSRHHIEINPSNLPVLNASKCSTCYAGLLLTWCASYAVP
jgi:hypothetical protein